MGPLTNLPFLPLRSRQGQLPPSVKLEVEMLVTDMAWQQQQQQQQPQLRYCLPAGAGVAAGGDEPLLRIFNSPEGLVADVARSVSDARTQEAAVSVMAWAAKLAGLCCCTSVHMESLSPLDRPAQCRQPLSHASLVQRDALLAAAPGLGRALEHAAGGGLPIQACGAWACAPAVPVSVQPPPACPPVRPPTLWFDASHSARAASTPAAPGG